MVNHWFGGKEKLFTAAVFRLPFDPERLLDDVLDGDPGRLGERIVCRFLTVWDAADGGVFAALVRSIAGYEQASSILRDILMKNIFGWIVATIEADQPQLRAALVPVSWSGSVWCATSRVSSRPRRLTPNSLSRRWPRRCSAT